MNFLPLQACSNSFMCTLLKAITLPCVCKILSSKNFYGIMLFRYGRLIGISMHKGYAFIQYTSEQDARNAVRAEDQRVYATQPIGERERERGGKGGEDTEI